MFNRREAIAAAICLLGSVALIGCGKKSGPATNPTEVKEFWDAMADGDSSIIDRLIRAKPYLANAKNDSGQTPLAYAKAKGDEELADVLQKAGGKE
jgi:ankyrin repeat protein